MLFKVRLLYSTPPLAIRVETEAGKLRRTAYGFPGEFRIKPYGFEYRSPSNAIFWEENLKVLRRVLETIVFITSTFAMTMGKEK